MRIGIDVTCWRDRRGFGRFTRELVSQLVQDHSGSHEFVLVADPYTASGARFPLGARVVVPVPEGVDLPENRRSLRALFRLSREATRARADVFWFPAVASFYPVLGGTPVVITMHDAMTEDRPELFFPNRWAHALWKAKLRLARHQAAAIVAPSESARQAVAAALRRPVEAITRIDEAPAAIFHPIEDASAIRAVTERYGLPAGLPLILYVGGINPHKNLKNLLSALARIQGDAPPPWHLALVGETRAEAALDAVGEVMELRERLGLAQHVTLTGFVSDEELAVLYNAATVLVMPSLCEGFGLPAVEAMACGLPVAASNRGSLPEVVGDGGLTFDPEDVPAMAAAIARVLGDAELRRDLGRRALARAASFSWARSADQMMTVLRCAAGR